MFCVESTGRPRGVGREETMRYVPTLLRTKVGNAVTASIVILYFLLLRKFERVVSPQDPWCAQILFRFWGAEQGGFWAGGWRGELEVVKRGMK